MRFFTFNLFFLLCYTVWGQEEFSDLQLNALRQLGISPDSCSARLSVEKDFPGVAGQVILVIPELVGEYEEFQFDATGHIIVVSRETGKIIYHVIDEGKEWYSDAVELDRITIDTAPYMLAPEKRAFGVRIHHYGHSRANPYSYETLSLYLPENGELSTVFSDFQTSLYHGEWNTSCYGEFKDEESLLMIGDLQDSGYNDLLIKTKVVHSVSFVDQSGECDETSCELTYKTVLHYKDGLYTYPYVGY